MGWGDIVGGRPGPRGGKTSHTVGGNAGEADTKGRSPTAQGPRATLGRLRNTESLSRARARRRRIRPHEFAFGGRDTRPPASISPSCGRPTVPAYALDGPTRSRSSRKWARRLGATPSFNDQKWWNEAEHTAPGQADDAVVLEAHVELQIL